MFRGKVHAQIRKAPGHPDPGKVKGARRTVDRTKEPVVWPFWEPGHHFGFRAKTCSERQKELKKYKTIAATSPVTESLVPITHNPKRVSRACRRLETQESCNLAYSALLCRVALKLRHDKRNYGKQRSPVLTVLRACQFPRKKGAKAQRSAAEGCTSLAKSLTR